MGIHNYQKIQAINRACKIHMYPRLWLFWVCPIWVHNTKCIFCASMQGTQLLTVFSMSTLGQYTTLQAMAFIWLIPGCPKWSCLRTAFLSFKGTTTWSTNIRHSLMMDKESLCHLNCWRSPVKSEGHGCLRNLWTFCIIGSRCFSFNLHFCHRLFKYNQWVHARNHPLCWRQRWQCRHLRLIMNWWGVTRYQPDQIL